MATSEAVAAPVLSTGTEFDRVQVQARETPALTEQQIRDVYCVDEIVATIYDKAAAVVQAATVTDGGSECCSTDKQPGTCCGGSKSSDGSKDDSAKPIKVVALQFPDHMLPDSPAIAEVLEKSLNAYYTNKRSENDPNASNIVVPMVYILADTSYSPCCVDVVAGQHVAADLIVHFGNACLSPVRGVEVIYVFGRNTLDTDAVYARFVETYGAPDSVDPEEEIYFVYDPEYEFALHGFVKERLQEYKTVVPTWILPEEEENNVTILPTRDFIPDRRMLVKDSQIPVRKYLAPAVSDNDEDEDDSTPTRSLFYVTNPNPSPSLLLHLSTLFSALHLLEAPSLTSVTAPRTQLMRRYRYMNMARTAGTIGILVNTLSLRDVRGALTRVQNWIKAAGKKHYTFVVGKPNVAKLANFDVVEIWVVLGCPLGGIVVDCEDYYRPIITPYELSLALQEVPEWSGKWEISLTDVIEKMRISDEPLEDELEGESNDCGNNSDDDDRPVFDPVTGKYVSTSRPLRQLAHVEISAEESDSDSSSDDNGAHGGGTNERGLVVKHSSQLVIKNTVSTAADHLYNKLTWAGLGSDFNQPADSDDETEDGEAKPTGNWAVVEKGRAGVARGYRVNAEDDRT
ncbi:hypothetical protein D0Z00_002899 [Geotrichum galactomycetum]|uniref:Uncharacterized protein n=1 Tax=Geotrichum galactomycetum TaxID=27317 RepID=A0ACB6V2U4_9ASCO|nr:hypothetical protein D0Z00_002899 [Geotrichum candidum]